ncbi:MAG: GTP cyclohydrolase II [Rhodospirillales bacterium]|nr:GTP cyclohydrolase II [Rhodospirillales bacterium]
MSDHPHLIAVPTSREPLSLLSVDRAVSDLRRGRPVVVLGSGGSASLVLAAEAVTPDTLKELETIAGRRAVLAVTARRATVLGLIHSGIKVVTIAMEGGLTADRVRSFAHPDALPPQPLPAAPTITECPAHSCESAAVLLAKTARLLPAALSAAIDDVDDPVAWAVRHDFLFVDAGDVFQYEPIAARSLRAVSQAKVPLLDAVETRVVAFRPRDGGLEHLALIIGDPKPDKAVLTRLHSECFTGDLLGSLRCDCGDQLRGAIREIASTGGGVLLYLAQEGRGIGLVNKLRAYELQDQGFDTMDANEQLGFDADERVYLPAAQMLRQLGFTRVRLLTNNPAKVAGLAGCGITVEERVPHAIPSNQHNERYLRTKAERGGHLF